MQKKILYIRENLPGGTDNYCKALYSMFKDDTHCQALPVEDIPSIPSRLFHYYYQQKALREAIGKADIIHINGYTAIGTVQAIITARQMRKKIVYTAHWHPFHCLRHPLLGQLFFNGLLRPVLKRCVHVVTTINKEDTAFFKTFHPHVVQIPHWFIPVPIQERPKKRSGMLLFVGRADDPVKGMEHLYKIPQGQYEIHCVGKGHIERKDFHQHIGITDEELANLYAEASLLVIPSKYEAFSYVALEAMSYGTPVLMSDRVRIADYLQGIKGYQIFHYGDYAEFLQKIVSTLTTEVDTEKVSHLFSCESAKKAYRDIYSAPH